MPESEKVINIPLLDQAASELKTSGSFRKDLTSQELGGIMQGIVTGLVSGQDAVKARAQELQVQIGGQKGRVGGTVIVEKPISATIGVNCVLANDVQPGRIKLVSLDVTEEAGFAAKLVLKAVNIKGKAEEALRNPNQALQMALAEQLEPRGVELTGASFQFKDDLLSVSLTSQAPVKPPTVEPVVIMPQKPPEAEEEPAAEKIEPKAPEEIPMKKVEPPAPLVPKPSSASLEGSTAPVPPATPEPAVAKAETHKKRPRKSPDKDKKGEKSEVDEAMKRREQIQSSQWKDIQERRVEIGKTISELTNSARQGTISPADSQRLFRALEEEKGLITEAQGLVKLGNDEFTQRQVDFDEKVTKLSNAYQEHDNGAIILGRDALRDLLYDYSEKIDELSKKFPGIEDPKDREIRLEAIRKAVRETEKEALDSPSWTVGIYTEPMRILNKLARPFRRKLLEQELEAELKREGNKDLTLPWQYGV